ncbi:hypothetical protein [Chitinophaga sp. sic0106]|uniref:hypothetical protein n=1 Tax=Chitinophaga sp. sic0106 TaxID=2854785 RepID=UPI001C4622F2|nr:hypothetical protein [Chitinophaga sp. sic0106]MBV7532565.1 hypothetical protein [Chitinophaga sp. sic0106]
MKAPMKTWCLAVCALLLFSCSKEVIVEPRMTVPGAGGEEEPSNPSSSPIAGTYKLISTSQKGRSETKPTDGEDMLSVMNYEIEGTNAEGTYVIDSKNMTPKDVSYMAAMSYTMMVYIDGEPFMEPVTQNISFKYPVMNVVSPYTLKGTDSLTLKVMSLSGAAVGAGTGVPETVTMHYAFSGDTLIMSGKLVITDRLNTFTDGSKGIVSANDNFGLKMLRISK